MRLALLFVLFTLSPKAHGIECDQQTFSFLPKVGALAPKKARKMLETNPAQPSPEVLNLTENDFPLAAEALRIGLDIQSYGNEALIYNLDGLVFLARGAFPNATEEQKKLYQNYLSVKNAPLEYYNNFQFMTALRVVGSLSLMGRTEESARLNAYLSMSPKSIDPNKLWSIRSRMSNTGRIPDQQASTDLCKEIQALKID